MSVLRRWLDRLSSVVAGARRTLLELRGRFARSTVGQRVGRRHRGPHTDDDADATADTARDAHRGASKGGGYGLRSVRARITIAFGVLIALGLVNLLVFRYGANRRSQEFDALQTAVERHELILEARYLLEKQHRELRIHAEILGGQSEPPPAVELEMRESADSLTEHLDQLASLAGAAGRAPIERLASRTDTLVAGWYRVYDHLGVEPEQAIEEMTLTVEPLARSLVNDAYPAAVRRERELLDEASAAFVRVDQSASRTTAVIFLVLVVVGGVLAITTSRDLLRGIAALRLGAERVGQGDLDHRIELRRRDELADVAGTFNRMAERLRRRSAETEEQKKIAESLLLNILPADIAEELRRDGRVEPKYLPDTTIAFADLVGFTRLAETLSTDRMVRLLDRLFTEFDRIVRSYRLEKLKTVGDAYMCAGGLLREAPSHPIDAVMAGFDLLDAVDRAAKRENVPLSLRVGMHTGPVAAGVVGIDKFAFDVWGETVNFAARLQSRGEANQISVSTSTYRRVKDFFECEYAGRAPHKGQQALHMYVITGIHPEIQGDGRPPPAFLDRYRRHFGEAPSAYPDAEAMV